MALWRRPARGNPSAGLEGLLAGLDRDQYEAATAPPGPLLVIAGAGAGKTRTLIARAAYAVERVGIAPQAILAIAFTNKACGEIATRPAARSRRGFARCSTVGEAGSRSGPSTPQPGGW